MVTAVREFTLEHHLVERLRFSGLDRENLSDLISILASLKNKYGIQPLTVNSSGDPVPTRLVARYMLPSTMLNKLMSLLLDTPRLVELAVSPCGYPRPAQFELTITVGD